MLFRVVVALDKARYYVIIEISGHKT
jgi:hypothetical protein